MTQLTDKYFAVEVPDWANGYRIENIPQAEIWELICYEIGEYNEPKRTKEIDLPPGNYRFLLTTKAATEEDARRVVESQEFYINGNSQGVYYRNYLLPNDAFEWHVQPLKSLRSLLLSKGLDGNKNYAIIEKL